MAFSQRFDSAVVYPSAPARYPAMKAGVRAGRFEIRTASMTELIANASGVDIDKVMGGPSWLDMERYDVVARVAGNESPQMIRLMLRSLLEERFGLAVHNEQRPMPGFALTKGTGQPKMKRWDGNAEAGCQRQPADGATIPAVCRGLTMDMFVQQLRGAAGDYLMSPVANQTGLDGAWDFTLRWTPRSRLAAAGGEGISIFDAIDHQLGLKLESRLVPAPVIVVDRVNKVATKNSKEAEAILPRAEGPRFEVETIKPTDPQFQGVKMQTTPNGTVNIQGVTLSYLIQTIWFVTPERIAGAPTWLDSERWDITTKIAGTPGSPPQTDLDSVIGMMRALLEDRFKLKTHMEERVAAAYTLTPVKPKMQRAKAEDRTGCKEGAAADAKDPRLTIPARSRLVTCRNITMAEFAGLLPGIANALNPLNGPLRSSVLDGSGLTGRWDFTLNFSPELGVTANATAPPPTDDVSNPDGTISLQEAISRQLGLKLEAVKRKAQVLVIDGIERMPEN